MLTRRDATRSLPWQQKQHNTSMSHSITAQRKFSDKIMLNLWACIAHEKCLGTRRKVMHCKISPRSCKINDSKMIQLSSEHQLVDRARFSARIVERLECFVKISCHSTQPPPVMQIRWDQRRNNKAWWRHRARIWACSVAPWWQSGASNRIKNLTSAMT